MPASVSPDFLEKPLRIPEKRFGRILLRRWRDPVLLLVWCGFLFGYGLSAGQLLRTEGLRARVAAEMLQSGDWIVPRLYGEPFFTKPPGMYLAIVLSSLPFGMVTEWTARIPSALAASATVFLFFKLFQRTLGRSAAWTAALMLPMSHLWLSKGCAAEIDMLQVFWVTASLVFLFRALEDKKNSAFWWLAALLCVAGGFLTKWTAPAFFYATAIPLLWWRGQLRLLYQRDHLVAAGLGAMLCLGWATAAISREGWETFTATVTREALLRVAPGYERPYPWWDALAHPLKILVVTLPWSPLALLTLRPGFTRLWDRPGQRLLQFLHCWTWPNLLLWSLMTEHTPRHTAPLFPGLTGLAVMGWLALDQGKMPWRIPFLRPRRFLALAVLVWFVVKVGQVHVTEARGVERDPRGKGQLLGSLVPHGRILYLIGIKDDGLLFYFGRPACRLGSPGNLPLAGEPLCCILTKDLWINWPGPRHAEPVQHLTDQQGDPIVLIRVLPPP